MNFANGAFILKTTPLFLLVFKIFSENLPSIGPFHIPLSKSCFMKYSMKTLQFS